MTWDESKHPRDEKGQFTYSDGSDIENNTENDTQALKGRIEKTEKSKSSTDILYGDTYKKEKQEKEYRSKLLNVLGNIATPAMVLYATTKELENAIKTNGLGKELKQIKNTVIQKGIESNIGKNYKNIQNWMAKLGAGKDTAGMLDLAHGINMNDRDYIKDTISLDNYNDPKVATDREYLKDKIDQQFKDYNFDLNKIKGYFFKSDSEPVQRLIENKDFQDMIKNHKDEIIKKGKFSAEFKKHGNIGLGQDNNFRNAIGKADFRNIYQDKEGNLHIKMYDTYDFNKDENSPLIKAGASQMDKGELKPFFTIHDIIIPKNKLDEIWK